jgi:hypothetical protein
MISLWTNCSLLIRKRRRRRWLRKRERVLQVPVAQEEVDKIVEALHLLLEEKRERLDHHLVRRQTGRGNVQSTTRTLCYK